MKTSFLILIIIMVFPALLLSQNTTSGIDSGNYSFMGAKSKTGFTIGSSYSALPGGAGFFSHSIAPHLQFRPGNNFTVTAGSILSTSSFPGFQNVSGGAGTTGRFMSTTVYALGAYQLKSKELVINRRCLG
jgi:hypothetical protein